MKGKIGESLNGVVCVEWLDSQSVGGDWIEFKDADYPAVARCTSVGWVVRDTDEYIVLVPSQAISGETCWTFDGVTIPRAAIVRVDALHRKEEAERET